MGTKKLNIGGMNNTNQPTTIEPLDGEMRELCPFCGTLPSIKQNIGRSKIARCGKQDCPLSNHFMPLDVWNTRTPSAEVKAALSDERERIRAEIAENLDLALRSASGFAELAYFIRHQIDSLRNPADIGEGEKG